MANWKYLYIYTTGNKVIFLDLVDSNFKLETNGLRLTKKNGKEERFYPLTSILYYRLTLEIDPSDTPS